ncbi:MAG: four helix bundle protein [Bacteroidota bacterium]
MRKYDLEDRLINFAAETVKFCQNLRDIRPAIHLSNQLIRSSTSPALNYGEANAAESRKDFVHKMKICLKELRESYNCLRIIKGADLTKQGTQINSLIQENNELISILVKCIETAKRRV